MNLTEKCVHRNYVYEGKIIKVRCDDAELPDGKPCVRELVEHSGGACVLYIRGGEVLLVKQYRYAYGETIYEIPAGKLNRGENPKTAAMRELEEETGVRAKDATLLYTVYPSPGYTNEKIYVYYVAEGEELGAHPDDGEFLSAEFVSLERVKEMLKSGEICDAKTIIALQAYYLNVMSQPSVDF